MSLDLETFTVERIFVNGVLPSAGTMRIFTGTSLQRGRAATDRFPEVLWPLKG